MAFSTATYLGIDLGTTALKCIITDHKQRVVGLAEVSLPIMRPQPGWSEQKPQDWWLALQKACKILRSRNRKDWGRIAAIGLSGQMHGAVVLNVAGEVLRPAILWNDGRAGAEAAAFNGKFSDIGRIAGVAAVAGFTAPKLLWLQIHEPRIFKQLAMVLAPKDFLRFRMSGEFITDPCDASGMSLLDVGQRKWSAALVEAAGIRLENLPRIEEGPRASAHLHKSAADFLGLSAGLPIAAGAGDAAASAIGIGAINDGDGFISLGTSAQYFVTTKSFRPRPRQMIQALGHGLPDLWYQVAALLNGASPLSWLNGICRAAIFRNFCIAASGAMTGRGAFCFCPISMVSAHRITTRRRGRLFTACMRGPRRRIWRWRFLKVLPCRWRIVRMFWSRGARALRNYWWWAAARAAPSGCKCLRMFSTGGSLSLRDRMWGRHMVRRGWRGFRLRARPLPRFAASQRRCRIWSPIKNFPKPTRIG